MLDSYRNFPAQAKLNVALQVAATIYRFPVYTDYPVSRFNASYGCRGTRRYIFYQHLSDYHVMGNHKGNSEEDERQQEIHQRTGTEHQKPDGKGLTG